MTPERIEELARAFAPLNGCTKGADACLLSDNCECKQAVLTLLPLIAAEMAGVARAHGDWAAERRDDKSCHRDEFSVYRFTGRHLAANEIALAILSHAEGK